MSFKILTQKVLCVIGLALPLATPAQPAETAKADNNASKKAEAIPWNQVGAKAGADYQGDGLTVAAIESGARLHCVFQRMDGEATAEGLWLVSTVTNQPADRFRIVATAVDGQTLAERGIVKVTGQKVRFSRTGLVEEYSVSMDGVRQDFVVTEKPTGGGQLKVQLAVIGARVESAIYGARLSLEKSGRKIAYSRVRAMDATGKELPARIQAELNSKTPLAVEVNDTGAIYPVTIDPTFSDANWISLGGYPGANGTVYAAVTDESGNLYIGGAFTLVGNIFATNVAQWNGSSWLALGSGIPIEPPMLSIVLALSGREQKEKAASSKGERGLWLGEWPLGRGFEEAGA